MAARKKKLKPGQTVEFRGKEYTVVKMFGPENKYVMIENEDHRFTLTAEILDRHHAAPGNRHATKTGKAAE